MQTQNIFIQLWKLTRYTIDYFLFTLFIILLILIFTLQTQKQKTAGYHPRLAWIRGGIYFASCFILSILTGVFSTLISQPIATGENLSNPIWWAFTLICGHVPNLIFTLTYLAMFGNALIFLLFQTCGLMICTYYMHFPKPTEDDRP